MSDLVLARNCCLARMLPGEEGLSGKAKSVKRFERSNGLDTALYKNYLYFFFFIAPCYATFIAPHIMPSSLNADLSHSSPS